MKTQGEIRMREIVNAYFNKPEKESRKQFCKSKGIKCYQLDRMIEIYGQRIEPQLKETAKEYKGPTPSGQRIKLIDLWSEETRKLIAIEFSDKEYPEYLRNEYDEKLSIRFDRTRLKVLVEIVMMDRTIKSLSKLSGIYKELCKDE